jgi:hypothetical protein
MSTLKRLALAILFIPLLFNAGFDTARVWQKHKVCNFVTKTFRSFPEVTSARASCVDVRDHFWLCDVIVETKDGERAQQLVPVPYEVLPK